jgi:hypothetical protein
MKANDTIDPARLSLLLNELRLPGAKLMWPQFADQADKEGWPAARFLAALAEHELPNATAAASSAISPRPGSYREKPSTASTSTPCR